MKLASRLLASAYFLQSLVSAFALQAVLTKEKQGVPISWSEEVRAGLFSHFRLAQFATTTSDHLLQNQKNVSYKDTRPATEMAI